MILDKKLLRHDFIEGGPTKWQIIFSNDSGYVFAPYITTFISDFNPRIGLSSRYATTLSGGYNNISEFSSTISTYSGTITNCDYTTVSSY